MPPTDPRDLRPASTRPAQPTGWGAARWASLLPLAVFLAAWQAYGESSSERRFFYSTPVLVAKCLWADATSGLLLRHVAITTGEVLLGFLAGNLVGALVGMALWFYEPLARLSRPYMVALASFPVFAIAPMTILWFGISWWAKVALAFWATVFLAMSQAYKGAEQVDPLLRRRFQVFGADHWTIFLRLLLPSSVGWLIASLRLTIAAALLGAFVGEFISSQEGLGHFIVRASGLYDTSRVLVGVLSMVVLALAMDWLVSLLERRVTAWSRR